MEFKDLSEKEGDDEKKSISEALQRYCELDTMAMVIIMEFRIDQKRTNY